VIWFEEKNFEAEERRIFFLKISLGFTCFLGHHCRAEKIFSEMMTFIPYGVFFKNIYVLCVKMKNVYLST